MLLPATDFLVFIYKQSIIDYKEYYKLCVRISMETSNTQHDCDNMEFWVFNNYMTFLTEIVEEKNKNKGTQETPDNSMDKYMSKSKSFLNSGMKNFPKPK